MVDYLKLFIQVSGDPHVSFQIYDLPSCLYCPSFPEEIKT